MRFLRVCAAALALAVAVTASVAAQQTESRVVGKLIDDSGGALPGVTVTVTSRQTGAVRTAVTEGDGAFAVTNLAPAPTR